MSAIPSRTRFPERRRRAPAVAAALCLGIAASGRAEEIAGIRDDGALVTFDSASPSTIKTAHAVTGLAQSELIVGVDFRPTDGALFAVGTTNRVYRIDPETGFAVSLGVTTFTPQLDGTDFGVAFDPAGTGLRVTSDTGQNLVLDPVTGTVAAVDPPLTYASGDANAGAKAGVVACAWTSSQSAGDVLYGIDLARGLLVKIETPSAGVVRTVGPLGVTGLVAGGFSSLDASPDTGSVFAVLDTGNDTVSREYSVNVSTGTAVQIGSAMPSLLRAAAVVPASPPAPPGTRVVALVPPADVLTFTTDTPGRILRTVHVRGLPPGDSFVGLAERPANGYLYGITRAGLYDIDTVGGTAALVGAGFGQTLPSTQYGCDFDPATDRLRVVSAAGLNVTVDPATGQLAAADATFAFAAADPQAGQLPTVRAIAFTGRAAPGTTSKCFVLESTAALLARLGSPLAAPGEARDGILSTIGSVAIDGIVNLPLGQALTATGDRTGYAAIQTSTGASSLFHVDLTGGHAIYVGSIATPAVVRALTAEPAANPPRIYIGKLAVGFNLKKPDRDTLTLKGAAPFVVGTPAGKSVTIDVGGLSKTFLLDSKGRGKLDDDTIHVGGVASHGIALKLVLKRENLALAFADEQMDGTVPLRRAPRQLIVTLTIDGKSYRATADLSYTAKPGKSGSATTN